MSDPLPSSPPAANVWSPAPARPRLDGDEVHVWRVRQDLPPSPDDPYASWLADDERTRAARFHFDRDRDRYVVRRGRLREIIGMYLDVAPAAVCFEYSSYGKPALAMAGGASPPLRFNLSHSHGVALYAFTRDRNVGVDVERIDPRRAAPGIAGRFFAPAEVTALRPLRGPDWTAGFFRCWTRKEGYIKAHGEGLSLPLDSFEVSVLPDAPPVLRSARDDDPTRWTMRELPPLPGYAAALVYDGQPASVRHWSLGG